MKIRKKIHDISEELIKIYKNRSISKVEPFKEDTPEQQILRVNLFIRKLQTN